MRLGRATRTFCREDEAFEDTLCTSVWYTERATRVYIRLRFSTVQALVRLLLQCHRAAHWTIATEPRAPTSTITFTTAN